MSQATVGITGGRGFIGSHLARRVPGATLIPRKAWSDPALLRSYVDGCNTIVHLAGMNRGDEQEIYDANMSLIHRLVEALDASGPPCHVIFASSTQRHRQNAYGRSKKDGEEQLRYWANKTGGRLTVVVIPNVFGPGARPFYNSVVATFCHQLARGEQPMVINDQLLELVWINDLVDQLCTAIADTRCGTYEQPVASTNQITVSELLAKLASFQASYFEDHVVPDLSQSFDARLYATFLSYIEPADHCHRPQVRGDERGDLCEVLRLIGGGQVFFSSTRPGAIRGNHYHTRKVEWFCVLRGEAVIRLRRVGEDDLHEFHVCGSSPDFISIPPLCAHQIENVGNEDLLTMFWCNEIFEPADPDTYYANVA